MPHARTYHRILMTDAVMRSNCYAGFVMQALGRPYVYFVADAFC